MFSGAGTTCRSLEAAAQAGHQQPAPAWRAYRLADASCSPPMGQLWLLGIHPPLLHLNSQVELNAGTTLTETPAIDQQSIVSE
jgi:hypothetical protein